MATQVSSREFLPSQLVPVPGSPHTPLHRRRDVVGSRCCFLAEVVGEESPAPEYQDWVRVFRVDKCPFCDLEKKYLGDLKQEEGSTSSNHEMTVVLLIESLLRPAS